MERIDPYEMKYGNPDWCHDAQPDGQKALSSLLAEFREHPDDYLGLAGFQDKETERACFISDAMEHGWPFAATLHDHADHTNLHFRWWIANKLYECHYKVTTVIDDARDGEKREPHLTFKLTHSKIYETERYGEQSAIDYLTLVIRPQPCANERVDMWWSLTGRMDQTMFHLALMPEAKYWMQLP